MNCNICNGSKKLYRKWSKEPLKCPYCNATGTRESEYTGVSSDYDFYDQFEEDIYYEE